MSATSPAVTALTPPGSAPSGIQLLMRVREGLSNAVDFDSLTDGLFEERYEGLREHHGVVDTQVLTTIPPTQRQVIDN